MLAQVPERSWERREPDPPVMVTVIVGLVDLAVKIYQTSRLVAPQPGNPVAAVYVAPVSVPDVVEHVVAEDIAVADPQELDCASNLPGLSMARKAVSTENNSSPAPDVGFIKLGIVDTLF